MDEALKKYLLAFVLLAAALAAVKFSFPIKLYLGRHRPAITLPDRPPPRDIAEARRQDLADLSFLPRYDRSFSPAARTAFDSGIAAIENTAGAMSEAAFDMAVSRLVALAGNAHTSVDKAQRARAFGRVPVRFVWFADGLYIVRAQAPEADLLGRRIVSIDGHPVAEALAAVEPYLSGTSERARDDSPPIFECPALLRAIWPDADDSRLTLGFADGDTASLTAGPATPDPFDLQPILAMTAFPAEGWSTMLGRAPSVPISLREPEHVVFAAPLDRDGLYVRINGNRDDARGPLEQQLAEVGNARPIGGWRRIVLDLRFNEGGNEMKTMDFTDALPRLLAGNGSLWILTGNATFSAGIITAARAKAFLGARAHIVGEQVGDHEPFWTGGGAPLVLRNSHIAVAHAYFKQDWAAGCHALDVCSPLQIAYGVAAGDLTPDVKVGWSFADYAAGRDTALERVRTLSRDVR